MHTAFARERDVRCAPLGHGVLQWHTKKRRSLENQRGTPVEQVWGKENRLIPPLTLLLSSAGREPSIQNTTITADNLDTCSNNMHKIRQAGCTDVDRWINVSITSLPIDGLHFGWSLLNRSRFYLTIAGLSEANPKSRDTIVHNSSINVQYLQCVNSAWSVDRSTVLRDGHRHPTFPNFCKSYSFPLD